MRIALNQGFKLGVGAEVMLELTYLYYFPASLQLGYAYGVDKGGGNQVGFTMVSEIKLGESYGGSLVGPLPAAVQTYTAYEAVVMSATRAPDAARAFIASITAPAARQVFAAAGWNF